MLMGRMSVQPERMLKNLVFLKKNMKLASKVYNVIFQMMINLRDWQRNQINITEAQIS